MPLLEDIRKFFTAESKVDELQKEVSQLQTQIEHYRPSLDTILTSGDSGAKFLLYTVPPVELYELSRHSDILRVIFSTLQREIFRKGFEVREKFKRKCSHCGKEFEQDILQCDDCGHDTRRPIPEQKTVLQNLIDNPLNENKQGMKDILEQIELDLDVCDNAYVIFLKDYYTQGNKIVGQKIREVIRASPLTISIICDRTGRVGYTDDGKKAMVCPNHRKEAQYDKIVCAKCGTDLLEAFCVVNHMRQGAVQPNMETNVFYYAKGEVCHIIKFMPSLLYGHSPLISLYRKVWTLIHMDRYLMTYFQKQRPPKGIFVVSTRNIASLQKAWDYVLEKIKVNPHDIVPLAIENERGTKSSAQFINFMQSLNEMQFIDARNEYRRTIGAVYGVLPLFSGDLPDGWGNEGLQVTVTTRAVEFAQELYKEKVFKRFQDEYGVTDWEIILSPVEQRDELRELQIQAQRIANAQQMANLGFEVNVSHSGEFKFAKMEMPKQVSQSPEQMSQGQMPQGQKRVFQAPDKIPSRVPDQLGENREQQFEGQPQRIQPHEGRFEGEPESVRRSVDEELNKGLHDFLLEGYNSVGYIKKDSHEDLLDNAYESIWHSNFIGLNREQSIWFKGFIFDSLKGRISLSDIIKSAITQLPSLKPFDVERIVRTEALALQNKGREIAYREDDPTGDSFSYKWLSSPDDRRCVVCSEVSTRSKDGVSLETLKGIINSVGEQHNQNTREWIPHPLCRCSMVRVYANKSVSQEESVSEDIKKVEPTLKEDVEKGRDVRDAVKNVESVKKSEVGKVIAHEIVTGEDDWIRQARKIEKIQKDLIPYEFRRYVNRAQIATLPKNIQVFVGKRGGHFIDIRKVPAEQRDKYKGQFNDEIDPAIVSSEPEGEGRYISNFKNVVSDLNSFGSFETEDGSHYYRLKDDANEYSERYKYLERVFGLSGEALEGVIWGCGFYGDWSVSSGMCGSILDYKINQHFNKKRYEKQSSMRVKVETPLEIRDMLKAKAVSKELFEHYYGNDAYMYRGISSTEEFEIGISKILGKQPRLFGTVLGFTDNAGIASEFGNVIKVKVASDNVWGGWWFAKPQFANKEREIMIEVPEDGFEFEVDADSKERFNGTIYFYDAIANTNSGKRNFVDEDFVVRGISYIFSAKRMQMLYSTNKEDFLGSVDKVISFLNTASDLKGITFHNRDNLIKLQTKYEVEFAMLKRNLQDILTENGRDRETIDNRISELDKVNEAFQQNIDKLIPRE